MITIHPARARFRTESSGITTWHSFSAGAHYDPDNVAFGPVVACDEHLLDPGAGFDRHPHARVELITWVIDGALEHSDAGGRERVVVPGRVQYQLAGAGIEHAERNASGSSPLHFVQLWLLTDEQVPDYDLSPPPIRLSTGSFDVVRTCRDHVLVAPGTAHLFVASGRFAADGEQLRPGDSVRMREDSLHLDGDGELLVVTAAPA